MDATDTNSLLKFLKQHRHSILALLVVAVILIWGLGCQSKTISITDPNTPLTRKQLQRETLKTQLSLCQRKAKLDMGLAKYNTDAELFNKRLELAKADLDYKDQPKTELFKLAGSLLTQWAAGGVPIAGLIGTLVTALGIIFGFKGTAEANQKTVAAEKVKTQAGALASYVEGLIAKMPDTTIETFGVKSIAPEMPHIAAAETIRAELKKRLDEINKILNEK